MDENRFDDVAKAADLVVGNLIEVGGTLFVISDISSIPDDERGLIVITLKEHNNPDPRHVKIITDDYQRYGVWHH